jgi:hypothetical protein
MDASVTVGFRGIFRTQWFQGKWLPPHQTLDTKNISVDWQELYAIVVASYGLKNELCFITITRLWFQNALILW